MLSSYILGTIIIPAVLFLIYCFIGFSRAKHDKGSRDSAAASNHQHKQKPRPDRMRSAAFAALALSASATLAAQTNDSAQSNVPDLQQALKETTVTAECELTDGFLVRGEWRRDFSNVPFFLTDKSGVLKHDQNTSTLGMVWWFGRKQGAW